jgi:hypothetical protein
MRTLLHMLASGIGTLSPFRCAAVIPSGYRVTFVVLVTRLASELLTLIYRRSCAPDAMQRSPGRSVRISDRLRLVMPFTVVEAWREATRVNRAPRSDPTPAIDPFSPWAIRTNCDAAFAYDRMPCLALITRLRPLRTQSGQALGLPRFFGLPVDHASEGPGPCDRIAFGRIPAIEEHSDTAEARELRMLRKITATFQLVVLV